MSIKTFRHMAKEGLPNASDVDSCVLYFRCNETNGTTLTDQTGVVYTPSSLTFDSSLGAVYPNHTDRVTASGTMPDFGTNSILVVVAGRIVDATQMRVAIGNTDATDGGVGMSNFSTFHYAITGADNFSTGTTTQSVATGDVIWVLKYVPGTSSSMVLYDMSMSALDTATDLTPTAITAGVNCADTNEIRCSGIKLYGAAYYSINGAMPDDVDIGIEWMGNSWKNGDKGIYPPSINW